jgi:hypothetical protein
MPDPFFDYDLEMMAEPEDLIWFLEGDSAAISLPQAQQVASGITEPDWTDDFDGFADKVELGAVATEVNPTGPLGPDISGDGDIGEDLPEDEVVATGVRRNWDVIEDFNLTHDVFIDWSNFFPTPSVEFDLNISIDFCFDHPNELTMGDLREVFSNVDPNGPGIATVSLLNPSQAAFIGLLANTVTTVMLETYGPEGNTDGTVFNAIKHALWSSMITQAYGPEVAYEFTNAYEVSGSLNGEFTAHNLMDLYNNRAGIEAAIENPNMSGLELVEMLLNENKLITEVPEEGPAGC